MSDSPVDQDSVENDNGGFVERASTILVEVPPARLFVWGAIILILAGVCAYFGLRFQNDLSFGDMQRLMENGSVTTPTYIEDQRAAVTQIIGLGLSILGFVFGVVGGLLPMWAVGRLIADAIKTGDNDE